jgi:plastocyanin domain-containing protein
LSAVVAIEETPYIAGEICRGCGMVMLHAQGCPAVRATESNG